MNGHVPLDGGHPIGTGNLSGAMLNLHHQSSLALAPHTINHQLTGAMATLKRQPGSAHRHPQVRPAKPHDDICDLHPRILPWWVVPDLTALFSPVAPGNRNGRGTGLHSGMAVRPNLAIGEHIAVVWLRSHFGSGRRQSHDHHQLRRRWHLTADTGSLPAIRRWLTGEQQQNGGDLVP